MASGVRLAVVGATGAVGQEMLKVLEERDFLLQNYYAWLTPVRQAASSSSRTRL